MNVPLLDLKREYQFFKKDIDKQMKDCFASQQWVLGQKGFQFEEKIANYLGVKYAVGVASGTDALILSLAALAIKLRKKEYFNKKDEIITTPFTFIATAESIVRAGATPVFVDIAPDTFNISPDKVKKAINKNTVGILPVHLYGLPCDMVRISKTAKKHNLFTLEDTAQSFGSGYKGKKLGTLGNCGIYSFFPSKNLGACGDAGVIVTNSNKLAETIRALRNHGQVNAYDASFVGYNSRLDSIQAAVLLAKLKQFDRLNKLKLEIVFKYNQVFKNIKEVKVPYPPDQTQPAYSLYTLKVNSKRDQLLKYLNSKGIGARIYYPLLLNKMKAFKGCIIKGSLKNAEAAVKKTLTLPLHPFLKEKEIEYIISTIKKFY